MTATAELNAWFNGTPTGGPHSDGRYPLTYKDGNVYLVYCPAAQALNPALVDLPVELFAEAAADSASQASGSAVTAESSRVAAQAAAADATAAKNLAQDWAIKAVDTPVTGGQFSAYHWAQKASEAAGGVSGGMPTERLKGRVTAGTGAVENLTAGQVRTLLNVADGATAGATWGVSLAGIPANITAWAAIAPSAKQDVLGYTPVNKAGDTMTGPLTLTPSGADYIVSSRSGYTLNHANLGNGQFGIWDATASSMAWLYDTASGGIHRFRGQVEESGYRVWSEARFNPASKLDARDSLGISAAYPPGNDWNNANQNGWYMGSDFANAPASGWSLGMVTIHNNDWIQQEVSNFNHGAHAVTYRRRKLAGTWGAWTADKDFGIVNSLAMDGQFRMWGGANTNNINRNIGVVHSKYSGNLGIYDNRVNAWLFRIDADNNAEFPQGSLSAIGPIRSGGVTAGVSFMDRGGASRWEWYSTGTIARLWNSAVGDRITVETNGTLGVALDIRYSGWLRSLSSGHGWYHEVHGGGIYMSDNTWVRVYNNKGFWADNTIRGLDIHDANGNVRYIPQIANAGNSNLATAHSGRSHDKTGNGAYTITIQPNATVAIEIGATVTFQNMGGTTGNLVIARGSGVAIYRNGANADITLQPGHSVTLRKMATNVWQA